jgi:hypothetical protein
MYVVAFAKFHKIHNVFLYIFHYLAKLIWGYVLFWFSVYEINEMKLVLGVCLLAVAMTVQMES